MTKSRFAVAIAAGLVVSTLAVPAAYGQNRTMAPMAAAQPRPAGNGIALLDVSAIFKAHTRFKSMMKDMEADVKRAEEQMKQERDTIRALSERLKEFRAGSPEYKQLEEQVAQRQSNLSVQVALQRKEFLQRESNVYHMIYQEIEQEVAYFAQQNGIAVVLRFSGEQGDPGKPDEVLRDINKQVVWSAPGLDITATILQRLEGRSLNPTNPSAAVPRQGVPYQR
ncbi:MAG: OmpH family outer membrane protein [Pirellulales bacterium]|nr:OmpH family outer membrane protein [Pirellulales bacterium]